VAEIDAKRKENFSEELKDIEVYLDFLEDMKSLPDEFLRSLTNIEDCEVLDSCK
jgi:hypothetical protein